MIGAILGDIIGSPYEFSHYKVAEDFPLFTNCSRLTDDSVMTVAVARALLDAESDAGEIAIKNKVIDNMKSWGRRYPAAGYGSHFLQWIMSSDRQPYNSCGNGSAMRVSAVGWLYDDLEHTRTVARWTAEVTHNHPEGIKGAESVACAIFLARSGASREEIRDFIVRNFGYDLDRKCHEIRHGYHFDVTCQGSVPESIIAFLEGENYEQAVRLAVYLGGDTDTMGCIAGAMAEAMYGIPDELAAKEKEYLPPDMLEVQNDFLEAKRTVMERTKTCSN